MKSLSLSLVLLLAGCGYFSPVDYYDGRWDPPEIAALSAELQAGNVGGQTVVISGSGFGVDPEELMVQFGSANATVLSAQDREIVVLAPPGPVGGGTVTVRVGTYTGYDSSQYTYAMGDEVAAGAGDEPPDEVGYVLVNNYWESCFGGLTSRLQDEYGVTDCQGFAYVGSTGLDGAAEALEFGTRRLYGGSQGWSGGSDLADGEWRVERPAEMPYLSGLDDYHVDLGDVSVVNSYWTDKDGYCVDLAETASYRYGGDADHPSATAITGSGLPAVSTVSARSECPDDLYYAPDELQFCRRDTALGVPDYVYAADWPIDKNFFEADKRSLAPADITLKLPDVGVDGLTLTVPEPLVVINTEGYEDILSNGTTGAQGLWGAFGQLQHCFDDDGNGERLDDVALSFEWPVTDAVLTVPGGAVLRSRTYVRMSITELSLGWFGGINNPVRATITVPDDNDSYKTTGSDGRRETRGRLSVPASVMYQLPSIAFPSGGGLGGAGLITQSSAHVGYMFIEVQRVTEYTVETDIGPVVFAYVTGDFGFTPWTNPTDDACHDCEDNDGDGWSDEEDPDCAGGGAEEVGVDATAACSDGVDNDRDGDVDAGDEDCSAASDNDESNCDNNTDDDGDGFEDEDDLDCMRGESETTADGCVDGLDNDADGWADADDPDCVTGGAEEGFGTEGCNDGLDGDVDGWTDAADPDCVAASFDEVGFGLALCNDGIDNDADTFSDADDGECSAANDEDEGA
ncbi:MAG: hypothetical protein EXR71_05565 [Myxococcales bacterium]|nr:hypothetical protein [Myxococcales bacterium]